MNFFLIERLIDAIKSGKPVMYYNIETTGEEVQKRISDALQNDQKITLSKKTLKYCGYKIKDGKLVNTKYEPDPNKEN